MTDQVKEAITAAKEVAKASEPLQQKLVEMADAIQAGIIKIAPEAMDITLSVTRAGCLISVISWSAFMLLAGYILKKSFSSFMENQEGYTNYRSASVADEEKYKKYRDFDDYCVMYFIPAFLVGVPFIIAIFHSPLWEFVGAFEPKIYLAHQLIAKVL